MKNQHTDQSQLTASVSSNTGGGSRTNSRKNQVVRKKTNKKKNSEDKGAIWGKENTVQDDASTNPNPTKNDNTIVIDTVPIATTLSQATTQNENKETEVTQSKSNTSLTNANKSVIENTADLGVDSTKVRAVLTFEDEKGERYVLLTKSSRSEIWAVQTGDAVGSDKQQAADRVLKKLVGNLTVTFNENIVRSNNNIPMYFHYKPQEKISNLDAANEQVKSEYWDAEFFKISELGKQIKVDETSLNIVNDLQQQLQKTVDEEENKSEERTNNDTASSELKIENSRPIVTKRNELTTTHNLTQNSSQQNNDEQINNNSILEVESVETLNNELFVDNSQDQERGVTTRNKADDHGDQANQNNAPDDKVADGNSTTTTTTTTKNNVTERQVTRPGRLGRVDQETTGEVTQSNTSQNDKGTENNADVGGSGEQNVNDGLKTSEMGDGQGNTAQLNAENKGVVNNDKPTTTANTQVSGNAGQGQQQANTTNNNLATGQDQQTNQNNAPDNKGGEDNSTTTTRKVTRPGRLRRVDQNLSNTSQNDKGTENNADVGDSGASGKGDSNDDQNKKVIEKVEGRSRSLSVGDASTSRTTQKQIQQSTTDQNNQGRKRSNSLLDGTQLARETSKIKKNTVVNDDKKDSDKTKNESNEGKPENSPEDKPKPIKTIRRIHNNELRNELRIVQTSGSGVNDCGGAAIGEWLMVQYLYGDEDTKQYLRGKDKENLFAPLFEALDKQSSPKVNNESQPQVEELKTAEAYFKELAAMPTAERQKKMGAAMRTILVEKFSAQRGEQETEDQLKSLAATFGLRFRSTHKVNASGDKVLPLSSTEEGAKIQTDVRSSNGIGHNFVAVSGTTKEKIKEHIDSLQQNPNDSFYIGTTGKALVYTSYHDGNWHTDEINKNQLGVIPVTFESLEEKIFDLSFEKSVLDITSKKGHSEKAVPVLTVFNEPDHWLAYLPESLIEAFNKDKEETKQLKKVEIKVEKKQAKVDNVNEQNNNLVNQQNNDQDNSQPKSNENQNKPQENKQPENQEQVSSLNATATLTTKYDQKEFYQNLTKYFDEKYADEKTASYPEYFDKAPFKVDSTNECSGTLTTKKGFDLKITSRYTKENDPSTAEMVITATTVPGTTSSAELKKEKLASIALAYAESFKANGMDPNKLQIDLRKIGKNWTKDEAIEAFKQAGFKRILHEGKSTRVDELTKAKEEAEKKAAKEAEENNSISGTDASVAELENKNVIGQVKKTVTDNLGATALITSTALTATALAYNEHLALAVGTAAVATAGALYKHGGVPKKIKENLPMVINGAGSVLAAGTGLITGLGSIYLSSLALSYLPTQIQAFVLVMGSMLNMAVGVGKITDPIAKSVIPFLMPAMKASEYADRFINYLFDSHGSNMIARTFKGLSMPAGDFYKNGLNTGLFMNVFATLIPVMKSLARHENVILASAQPERKDLIGNRVVISRNGGGIMISFIKIEPDNKITDCHHAISKDSTDELEKELIKALSDKKFDNTEVESVHLTNLVKQCVMKQGGTVGVWRPEALWLASTVQNKVYEYSNKWPLLTENQQLWISFPTFLFSGYLLCTTGDWSSPQVSWTMAGMSLAVVGLVKAQGAPLPESILTASAAMLPLYAVSSVVGSVFAGLSNYWYGSSNDNTTTVNTTNTTNTQSDSTGPEVESSSEPKFISPPKLQVTSGKETPVSAQPLALPSSSTRPGWQTSAQSIPRPLTLPSSNTRNGQVLPCLGSNSKNNNTPITTFERVIPNVAPSKNGNKLFDRQESSQSQSDSNNSSYYQCGWNGMCMLISKTGSALIFAYHATNEMVKNSSLTAGDNCSFMR